ncbi:PREDICTED: uncharacterized protein LOC108662413 [Theobroma cacao]|uniref:Uncharacterized protein LOC108662413 n=1 Tax=Theobroma cacao TaxID=3641 RepID=A0AB32WK81_THECC|nr:PREDICTED: uncharacterized protein LOC108662413 [Theobroma cacao]
MEEMNQKWGLQCLYGKAWQLKEYAESLVFGPSEESFQLFPSYFHMLERENPDIITGCRYGWETMIQILFLGVQVMYPGIRMSKYIQLHLALAPMEDEESWSWFLNQLHSVIGCPENVMFISDQHLGIKNAVEKVYKDAHQGLCNYHLGKNVKNKFKCEDVTVIFTLAANCYKVTNFNRHMNQLKLLCKPAYDSLMRLGPKKWARARSLVRQYKLMTSNIAECINPCLRHARKCQ